MGLAKKYSVPSELALLYEVLNSVDLRTYIENGKQHVRSDEFETSARFEAWMRERGLLRKGERIAPADHRRALELREALRAYLQLAPDSRARARNFHECLNRISKFYPLVVKIDKIGTCRLLPTNVSDGFGQVLAELFSLSESGRLDRLKVCSSEECRWVFFDRSKPGNRRWCSSFLCGNRQKTRNYRKRVRSRTTE
jgi:predicted RNA-binding Zn ribbon-like protein